MNHEKYEQLLMKAIDNVLSPQEQIEWNKHLQDCLSCQSEFADFQKLTKITDEVRQRILQHAQFAPIQETQAYQKLSNTGYFLFFLGWLLLLILAGKSFFFDPHISFWTKLGVSSLLSGFLTLFGQVVYRRLRSGTKDPYEDIDV